MTDVWADELLAAYDAGRLIEPFSRRGGEFSLDAAHAVADGVRRRRIARGETPRGYKIGFTNRSIWPKYGVYAPIWGPVWDSTLTLLDGASAAVSLRGLVQPRLEPEIVFGMARTPSAGMREARLLSCLGWVAHGFEIVHTHFEGWRFEAADTVADFALHGRLVVGPRVALDDWTSLGADLSALRVSLHCNGVLEEEGSGAQVLDGPLNALRLWVDAMAAQTPRWTIEPGDVVTTGTLTDAWPLAPGQRWTTALTESRLGGLTLDVET
jgi:2-keto-4-pentenoate hydratase